MITRVLLLFVALFPLRLQSAGKSAEDVLKLGSVRIDGTLDYEITLGTLDLGGGVQFPLSLRHRIVVLPSRVCVSRWEMLALKSSLVPEGRSLMKWKEFFGNEYVLKSPSPSNVPRAIGPNMQMRGDAMNVCEIRTGGGWTWQYESGILKAGSGPTLLKVLVSSQGGAVSRASFYRMGGEIATLEVHYDAFANLLSLKTSKNVWTFSYLDGRLGGILKDGRSIYKFKYVAKLLTAVESENELMSLRWEYTDDYKRSDSRWSVPVRVTYLNDLKYKYTFSEKGYRISRMHQSGLEEWVVYNPAKGQVSGFGESTGHFFAKIETRRGNPQLGQVIEFQSSSSR